MDTALKDTDIKTEAPSAAAVGLRDTFYIRYVKRALDIVFSALALIVTLPVNLLLAICTYFDVGRPILFKQKRPGKDGRLITICKFRNMTNDVDENGVLLPARLRVTRFGRFVRGCSLDELLQFWNILIGEMSIIGPRPLPVRYMDHYSARQMLRFAVKPGLECPTLVPLDHARSWDEQLENDAWYAENVSFWLDVRLLFRLVQFTFDRKNARIRGAAMKGGAFAISEKTQIGSR
jgi:lipopolysaccharide/colanic/teichoic acid biosynthesis glycosyltransferase